MRIALAALVAVACSGKEESKPATPPTSSAPASTAVKVDPPADAAAPAAAADAGLAEEIALTLTADGKTSLGGKEVEAANLAAELKTASAHARALVVVADKKVPHGRVVEVMEMAKEAGFEKMAIKTGAPP